MRIGTAISVVFHTTLVVLLLMLAGVNTFEPTTAEAITVDIVREKEAPEKPNLDIPIFDFDKKNPTAPDTKTSDEKTADAKPADNKSADQKPESPATENKPVSKASVEPKAAEKKPHQKTAAAPPQQPTPPAQSAQPTRAPEQPVQQPAMPQQSVPQAAPIPYANLTQKFANLTGADNSNFDAPATVAADVTIDATHALRERIRECAVLPKSVSPNDPIEFVLRIALRRDGTLAGEPDLFKIVRPTEDGAILTVSAKRALIACQPYTMLPADKYNEWKTLDLGFTTRDFKS